MDTKAKIALGVGGAVIALGAAVGVGALAANLAVGETATPQAGQDGRAGAGPGARGGTDTAQLARTLATKLGVDETTVAEALKEVMAANRPAGAPSGRPSGDPSDPPRADGNRPGGSAYVQTLAKALAQKLNLDEATVLAALSEAMASPRGPAGRPSSQPTR